MVKGYAANMPLSSFHHSLTRARGLALVRAEEATEYFESGGEVTPGPAPPPKAAPMAKPSREDFKKWFPKADFDAKPKFRVVCFHNAGSAESVYTGKGAIGRPPHLTSASHVGVAELTRMRDATPTRARASPTGMRVKEDNPLVKHCQDQGGQLLACELPGREQRRNDPRHRQLRPYCEDLFPVLAPLLQEEDVPYVVVGHSMGTWMSYVSPCFLPAPSLSLPLSLSPSLSLSLSSSPPPRARHVYCPVRQLRVPEAALREGRAAAAAARRLGLPRAVSPRG